MSPAEIKIGEFGPITLNSRGRMILPGGVDVNVFNDSVWMTIPDIMTFRANSSIMVRRENLVSNKVILKDGQLAWEFMGEKYSVRVVDEVGREK
jgi:hypothetical protein